MQKEIISEEVKQFGSFFTKAGFKLYVVGGAVRDFLLKKENHDLDFSTDAHPKDIIDICKVNKLHVIFTGLDHGTLTIIFKSHHYEVTTFRADGDYLDNRHPDQVTFISSLEEDLKRRDFTINALAIDVKTNKFYDNHNGKKDLKNKIVRAIGEPRERFNEDALRMMRACRFCSQLDFQLEEESFKAIKELNENIKNISFERIRDEINKILESEKPSRGLRLLYQSNLLEHILPELKGLDKLQVTKTQNLFDIALDLVDKSALMKAPLVVRISALFFDIAATPDKPYRREKDSSNLCDAILKKLKYSNEIRKISSHLIQHQHFSYTNDWSDGSVRRFVNKIGKENIRSLFQLIIAKDQVLTKKSKTIYLEFLDRIETLTTDGYLSVNDLKVNGHDMMALGFKGKNIGDALNHLLEAVLDDPSLNQKDKLLELAIQILN